jgi:uncharacterized membrane protein YraQ (UPF0718 family)
MSGRNEWKHFILMIAVFLVFFYLPLDRLKEIGFGGPFFESIALATWYAREHVILCLIPAFFIAGAITVFVSQASVLKYLGPKASKALAYSVASVAGAILAVCSCTVLPLFAGIYKRGAGLGPACTFLYAGPAINVLAVVLTAKVLGSQIGIARAVGAVVFSIVVGLLMHFIFRKEELERAAAAPELSAEETRPLWKTALYFAGMVAILVFANWARPADGSGTWNLIFSYKWVMTAVISFAFVVFMKFWLQLRTAYVAAACALVLAAALIVRDNPLVPFAAGIVAFSVLLWRDGEEGTDWLASTWTYAKQMLPLLLVGVLVAGALLGRPGHEGLIPSRYIAGLVGGNSVQANLFASVAGALMYFATLTEVPILQGLLGSGMGKGPALALLLAGPAVSLPNLLVIRSIMGTRKTLVFLGLIIIMATITGKIFGTLWG